MSAPDFRSLAIEAIADHAHIDPPAGWCDDFDAAHAYIPAWALCGEKPHERFIAYARRGNPNLQRQLSNIVRRWLTCHQRRAPEIDVKAAEIREAWVHRDEWPEDWAPYQRIIDDAAAHDVPY